MQYFVNPHSVVRQIWSHSDTILFIFAGAAAEFALNKAVDWLYFTGKLPADPIGRLFSTVDYARQIVFSTRQQALSAIDRITKIHSGIEHKRGYEIPDWAYRDVLYMLIYYSVRAYELLQRRLTDAEKEEVYDVFFRLGSRMQLKELPLSYREWESQRITHLEMHLQLSPNSTDLFTQYRKHLGPLRFKMLLEAQKLIVPEKVKTVLGFNRITYLRPALAVYKLSKHFKLDGLIKKAVLPIKYQRQIRQLDLPPVTVGNP